MLLTVNDKIINRASQAMTYYYFNVYVIICNNAVVGSVVRRGICRVFPPCRGAADRRRFSSIGHYSNLTAPARRRVEKLPTRYPTPSHTNCTIFISFDCRATVQQLRGLSELLFSDRRIQCFSPVIRKVHWSYTRFPSSTIHTQNRPGRSLLTRQKLKNRNMTNEQ